MSLPAFLSKDRSLVIHAAEGLEAYLLSSELYGPPSYGGGLDLASRLTVGTLLLSLERLKSLGSEIDRPLDTAREAVQQTMTAWRVHWQQKAGRELEARLSLWSEFLDAWLAGPSNRLAAYAVGVRNRAILHLLMQNAGTIAQAHSDWLSGCDRRLRAATLDGEFVWENELAAVFPQPLWWFLFRKRTR